MYVLTFAMCPQYEDKQTREHVERLFKKLDLNGDGVITVDEFVQSCLEVSLTLLSPVSVKLSAVLPRGEPNSPQSCLEVSATLLSPV